MVDHFSRAKLFSQVTEGWIYIDTIVKKKKHTDKKKKIESSWLSISALIQTHEEEKKDRFDRSMLERNL